MTEQRIFDLTVFPTDADAVCVTTNGIIRRDGNAVMGAGIAKAFAMTWHEIPQVLANKLHTNGNHTHDLGTYTDANGKTAHVVSFPTKNHWRNDSDINLIRQSAEELRQLANIYGWRRVYVPRPGCSCGNLDWNMVKDTIEPILDDRFIITHR